MGLGVRRKDELRVIQVFGLSAYTAEAPFAERETKVEGLSVTSCAGHVVGRGQPHSVLGHVQRGSME